MILDPTLTVAYILLATALAIAPGPDVLFVVANGLRHKAKGAVASALGIGMGSLLHAIAAALGISALIAASPLAFDILRYAGAAYLVYLAVGALRSWLTPQPGGKLNTAATEASPFRVFTRGLLTNVLNPKVVVFYLALLPQFVSPELGHVGLQVFLLGCIHNVIGITFLMIVGVAAGRASSWLETTRFGRWLDALAATFFIGLAVRLVVSGEPETVQ